MSNIQIKQPTILQKEAAVLRETAKEVLNKEITSPKIRKILSEMKIALESQDDGVAIAAPQIGYPVRIFVVSKKALAIHKKSKLSQKNNWENNAEVETLKEDYEGLEDLVFINPILKKISKEKREVEEGCLSVRYLYGKVLRSHKATVEAFDENGKKFTLPGTGLMAQIFQHEIDHLDGILFIDKAKDLEDLPPENLQEKVELKKEKC